MRRPWWLLLVLAAILSLAFAAVEGDELERNRRLLEKWKADPDHYQRLRRDLAAFYSLPQERQDAVRFIDQYIHEAEPSAQARMWAVLERYSAWLDRLTEQDRRLVLDEPSPENRLAIIRGLRQREWIERLPKAIREELDLLPSEKRVARITNLRLAEQRRRVVWQRPLGGKDEQTPRPTRMSEMPRDVQAFFQQHLQPRLNKQDERHLKQAEGKWPDYPRELATLADRYPVLPEGPRGKITRPDDLPAEVKKLLRPERMKGKGKGGFRLQHAEGKWPDYALAVSVMLRGERNLPPLGASRPDEFPAPIRAFLLEKLLPALSMSERGELEKTEGRWPDYPRRLLALARKQQLIIPQMSLPGRPDLWEAARVAKQELSDEERASIELIATNPKLDFERMPGKGVRLPMGKKKPGRGIIRDGR